MDQHSEPRDPTEPIRPRRPILVTLIFLVFALWTVLGWLRFSQALTNRAVILEFLPESTFWYLLVAGLIWGLGGLPVLWGLARGSGWALKIFPLAALVYPFTYWLERLLIWQDPEGQGNWLFMLFLTVLWVGLVGWVLQSKRARRFFD